MFINNPSSTDNEYRNDKERSLISSQSHLPSKVVRETMPPVVEEIHLRDYIDVIVRRKWAVIIIMLATFFSVAVITFSTTPLFKSTGVLNASPNGIKANIFDVGSERFLTSREFFETQVKLLQSNKIIEKTITALDLQNNKYFNRKDKKTEKGLFSRTRTRVEEALSYLKDMVRPKAEIELEPEVPKAMTEHVLKEKALIKFRNNLEVEAIQDTQLIQVSFDSPSATLSAEVVNEYMRQFLKMLFENKMGQSRLATDFLQKQIDVVRKRLEKSETELNEFTKQSGIVSMDLKLNPILRQLEEVNDALAKAVTERVAKESLYQQSNQVGGKYLPQVLNNELIQQLKGQHATLFAEYQDLSTTFKPGYPKMKQLKARMKDLEKQYDQEINKITQSIKNEYETAVKKENHLRQAAAKQKKLAMELNETSTRYMLLKREVETNKEIYKSLLTRSKEIEASVGSDVGNIEIADPARIPLNPYTPKIFRNLILGIFMGLFGGVGVAFLLEYMDKTVKDPDEFVRRYQIPILGLIPYDKESGNDFVRMAFKPLNEPRTPLSEAIRSVMVSIKLAGVGNANKTIMVTSVLPDVGKSTIATNLSLSMLPDDSRVLLIDTDMRKPTLHKTFNRENKIGLSSFLTGTAKAEEVIFRVEMVEQLYFIPSGPLPSNPAEIIASGKMRSFIKTLAERFDHVIIDAAPFHGFAEILILANMVDGVILVTELNKTPRDGIEYFRKAVTNVGGHILGTMINKVSLSKSYGGYGGSYCDYSYGRD